MEDFNNQSNIDPITYAVINGDISRGASPSDLGRSYGSLEDHNRHLDYGGVPSRTSSVVALVLSVSFLIVAILSW